MPVDLGIRIGGQAFGLTYDTTRNAPLAVPGTDYVETELPSFGTLWLSSLHKHIVLVARDSTMSMMRVARGDGRILNFDGPGGAGAFPADQAINDRLVRLVDETLRYTDASSQALETYSPAGLLTRIDRASGAWMTFTYSDGATPPAIAPKPGLLVSVQDNYGRTVRFEYLNSDWVIRITDPAGQVILPAYDAYGNLSQLTWQDGKVRTFLYENTALRWALTGVVDENNARYATVGYDSAGRAISSELAGGVEHYSVTYTQPPVVLISDTYNAAASVVNRVRYWQPPQAPVITGPNGATIDLGISMVGDNPSVVSKSQPAGSGCAASTSATSYDASGNAWSVDDFNGNRTCSAFDTSRNLETSRVEGLASGATCGTVTQANATLPTGSRKVSTQWHPDWRLQSRLAEPKKLTTRVYNGQPDPFNGNTIASCAPSSALLPDGKPIVVLCKQVEQATSDADGSQGFSASVDASVPARTSSYTYNSYGQVLTAQDARGFTTTYAYYADTSVDHTLGDLQSVTNAAGHVSTFDRYNPHGQVLQSTDPNGVVTIYSYDLRQRPTSVTVAGQTTGYGYDNAGQLTQVTLPDQTMVSYSYDAAHRLTGVTDGAGNTVTYTVDNSGNRTGEQTKDPTGALARNVTRAFDALDRLQSVTGTVR